MFYLILELRNHLYHENLSSKLNLKAEPLEKPLQVEIANQEIIPIDQICPNCDMEIEGQNFKVNLIPFKLGEFDIILGMDWLTECEARIDCKGKNIKIRLPGGKLVVFRGQKQTRKFLTMMQTKRLLGQGCEAYLAHVVDTERKIPDIKEVEVVSEFEDVFPKDLPGLPPRPRN